jgi:hypothetical protein
MLIFEFIAIQAVSLSVMILFVHGYKRIAHKHEDLVHTIESGVKPSCMFQSTIIIWNLWFDTGGTITTDANAIIDQVPHPNRVAGEINQLLRLK